MSIVSGAIEVWGTWDGYMGSVHLDDACVADSGLGEIVNGSGKIVNNDPSQFRVKPVIDTDMDGMGCAGCSGWLDSIAIA